MKLNNETWRLIAKSLVIAGFVCCLAFFLAEAALIAYYSANRPDVPRQERGWTVDLSWTHPMRYGTGQDEGSLQLLFDLGFYSFGLIAVGEAVKIYKLDDYSGIRTRPKVPWNHKWGAPIGLRVRNQLRTRN